MNFKILNILILIQLVFGIQLLSKTLEIITTKNFQTTKVYKNLGENNILKIVDKNVASESMEKSMEFSKWLIKTYNLIYTGMGAMIIDEIPELREFEDELLKSLHSNEKNKTILSQVISNKEVFEKLNIKLSEGNLEEFKYISEEEVPCILGADYKESFQMGDLIKDEYVNYRVVGFMERGNYITNGEYFDPGSMVSTDKLILTLANETDLNYNIGRYTLLEIDDTKIGSLVSEIKEQGKKLGLDLDVYNNKILVENYKQWMSFEENLNKLTLSIISIFISISYLVIFMLKISKNSKEYAIHIMAGAKDRDIVIRNIFEIIIINGSALIIVMMLGLANNIKVFQMVALILAIYSLALCLIPIIKLKSVRLSEEFKGE